MKLDIVRKSKPTGDSISLYFSKNADLAKYKAGQHALLSIRINGEVFKRTYSFHTSPDIDENVGITVRAVEGGLVSNYLQINGAADISLDGVAGDFVVEPYQDNRRHLVCVVVAPDNERSVTIYGQSAYRGLPEFRYIG